MEIEDSRNALYCDPNAYIMGTQKHKEIKKVVFSEPYETVPNHYINNNFEKGKCDYCNKNNCNDKKEEANNKPCNKPNNSFGLSSLMPLLTMFGGKGGGMPDFSKILSNVGNGGGIMSLLGNKDIINVVLNMFSSNQTKNKNIKKDIPTTEFEIKNYTRVE